MSSTDNIEADDAAADLPRCASCGKSELDGIKLTECTDCKSVQYCSDTCQELHRPEHEAKCKERAAELRDELLFQQPEGTHLGDCPICCLPLPLATKTSINSCCSKLICDGCLYADIVRHVQNIHVQSHHQHIQPTVSSFTCPFCRHPRPETNEEGDNNLMERVAANDAVATCNLGQRHYRDGDYEDAFKYFTKSAELDDAEAHHRLTQMYHYGHGVEKDETKKLFHLEKAAIAGHPHARYNLACYEEDKGRYDRAVKHFIIAANLGDDNSIQALKEYYKDGDISKDDFAAALRGHYTAVAATKSPQREEAARADSEN